MCTALQIPQGSAFLWEACDWCVARLQNFFTHIRKLPHFDTRFGAVLPRWSPPQKAVFSVYAGRSVEAFLLSWHMCLEGQFLGSKRVSKWGNFLISLNFFCKPCASFINPRKRTAWKQPGSALIALQTPRLSGEKVKLDA